MARRTRIARLGREEWRRQASWIKGAVMILLMIVTSVFIWVIYNEYIVVIAPTTTTTEKTMDLTTFNTASIIFAICFVLIIVTIGITILIKNHAEKKQDALKKQLKKEKMEARKLLVKMQEERPSADDFIIKPRKIEIPVEEHLSEEELYADAFQDQENPFK